MTRAAMLVVVSLLLWGTLFDVACLVRLVAGGPSSGLAALIPRGPGSASGWLSLALGAAAVPGWFALAGGVRRSVGRGADAGERSPR